MAAIRKLHKPCSAAGSKETRLHLRSLVLRRQYLARNAYAAPPECGIRASNLRGYPGSPLIAVRRVGRRSRRRGSSPAAVRELPDRIGIRARARIGAAAVVTPVPPREHAFLAPSNSDMVSTARPGRRREVGRHVKMRIMRSPVRMVRNQKGMLRIFEKDTSLPFALKRCYVISHVPNGKQRGGHAVSCDLFFTTLTGTCRLTLRRGRQSTQTYLSNRTERVLVPKGMWLRADRFSRGAILLVCASQLFRHTRYFQKMRGK
jgi:hypothetical protein